MLENFKPISLILFAGALCFPKSVYLELVLAKQGSSILKGASVAALYGSRAGNRNGSLKVFSLETGKVISCWQKREWE